MLGANNNLLLLDGYLVDSTGYINFPVLGPLRVAGQSLNEARAQILGKLSPFLSDPVVNIRFLNFKVTILGEVAQPGTYTFFEDKITLLEVLGACGDLTPYANRTNILIVREKDGNREFGKINLQNTEAFFSPYFYVYQNDLIYIEPGEAKVATVADPLARIISYGSAFLSLVTIIFALTR